MKREFELVSFACGCSQSLGVDQLLGNVEGSGPPINLGDTGRESGGEMDEHSRQANSSLRALVPLMY